MKGMSQQLFWPRLLATPAKNPTRSSSKDAAEKTATVFRSNIDVCMEIN